MRGWTVRVEENAEIPTWFGIGGRADLLARPEGLEELAECLRRDPRLRVLGDGANLLVADEGVGDLVVALSAPRFCAWEIHEATGRVRVGAGANLPKLINECVRRGLAGIEGLAGIPATVGGALVMNAGGAFGQIGDVVERIAGLDRSGRRVVRERSEINFDYRSSGLGDLVLIEAELKLTPGDPAAARSRQKDVMAYKSKSQPMAEKSAGCVFKNPTLRSELAGIGPAGMRVSAGLLIDRAGCKGLRAGGAEVSPRHANFVVTHPGARADDVLALMDAVRGRVLDAFGVELTPEVVVWRRSR